MSKKEEISKKADELLDTLTIHELEAPLLDYAMDTIGNPFEAKRVVDEIVKIKHIAASEGGEISWDDNPALDYVRDIVSKNGLDRAKEILLPEFRDHLYDGNEKLASEILDNYLKSFK